MDSMLASGVTPAGSRVDWIWRELVEMQAQAQISTHPYVVALCRGELSRGGLQILATEYDHVAVAIALASHRLAACTDRDEDLQTLADAAAQDVERWRRFSFATGWGHADAWQYAEDPFPDTTACAAQLAGSARTCIEQLVGRVYMGRTLQVDLARAVAASLENRYRFSELALGWFTRHRFGDPSAEQHRQAISRAADRNPFVALNSARETARTIQRFYDSLYYNRLRTNTSLTTHSSSGGLTA